MANSRNAGGGILAFAAGLAAGWMMKRYLDRQSSVEDLKRTLPSGEPWSKLPPEVRQVIEDAGVDARKLFRETEDRLKPLLGEAQNRWDTVDADKYTTLVQEVFQDFRENQRLPARKLSQLKKFFLEDYRSLTRPPADDRS